MNPEIEDKLEGCALLHCFGTAIEAATPEAMPTEIMYAPAGISTIYPKHVKSGKPIEITINVKPAAAAALQASKEYFSEKMPDQKMFADKNHEEKEATFWPAGWRS